MKKKMKEYSDINTVTKIEKLIEKILNDKNWFGITTKIKPNIEPGRYWIIILYLIFHFHYFVLLHLY